MRKKFTLFFICILSGLQISLAQSTVNGVVRDVAGQPLPGVSVTVRGTAAGTQTDQNGSYRISLPPKGVLSFSFVGFKTQEVEPAGRQMIDVTLTENSKSLNEVVVIGYGTTTKRQLSTSVSTVGSKALERQVVSSFENALQGQAPGVQVSSPSGQPGSAININIRGRNSISLSTSPLFVIDGVPTQPGYDAETNIGNQRPNPLSSINPADIESIDVLKDAAAAAIYGSRAANGVVVITTKRGKAGKSQVDFNMYYGRQELAKKIKLLNGQQWAGIFNEARVNAGLTAPYNPDTVRTNTDWQDLIYHDAPIQNYQLAVRGGSDKTKYYVSGSYFNQDGIIKNSNFKRYAAKINLDQVVSDNFRIGTSLNLSETKNNRSIRSELSVNNSGVILGALQQIPTMPVYNADGTYALNPFSQTDNPYGNLLETNNNVTIDQVFGNLYGEYDILKNLVFRSSIGLDYRNQLENQYNTRKLPGTQNAASASRGSASTGTNNQSIWLWENNLTFTPKLGTDHHLTLLGGYSVQNSDRFTSGAGGFGFPSDIVPYLFAASTKSYISSFRDQWGLISYYTRATYNYKDRYLASASIRSDGSSRFASGKRFGYFPAASFAWRISEEPFFSKTSFISDLKLRTSFGANGNQNIGINDRFSTYGTGYNYSNYTGDGSVAGGIAPNKLGNDQVTWETTYQYNVGTDISLFSDRVTLSFDAYLKRTDNLLTNVQIPYSGGIEAGTDQVATQIQNLGKVENKGLELGINSANFRGTGGFSWNTQFNFSINRNKVLDLGTLTDAAGIVSDRQIISGYSIVEKGQPLGAFYGYVVQGIFQNAAEITSAPKQPNAAPGDYRFADINGDGVINDKDRTVIGNPNPDFIAGITNTFGYKGFDLSFFFQGTFGNDIYNQNRTFIENMVSPFNQSVDVLNRWTTAGQNTQIAREVFGDPNGNSQFSTRYVEKGTYVRLKNLTLGYTIPASVLRAVKISSARIFFTGQNLWTITNYKGYDPEVNADPLSNVSFGRDYGVYPQPRTYTLGVNVQF